PAARGGAAHVAHPRHLPRVRALAPAGAPLRGTRRGRARRRRPRPGSAPGGAGGPAQAGAGDARRHPGPAAALPRPHLDAVLREPGPALRGGGAPPRAGGGLHRLRPRPLPDPPAPRAGEEGVPVSATPSRPRRGAERLYADLGTLTDARRRREFLRRHPALVSAQAAARAREIFTRQGDDVRLARLELNVGNIYHRQDRFAEALAAYEQAYERLLPHRNVEGIAVALGNMAMCLITLNDFGRALETHQ